MSDPVRIGALAPLSAPGWSDAGRHLLAGLVLAADDVNAAGGIGGKRLELLIRDTAGTPQKAAQAVDELTSLGVTALAGEYHSVVARAVAARADALSLPFLCSSAVLDALVDGPTDWVARLSPPQSRGWRTYADFLTGAGHRRIAIVAEPSVYWAAGTQILKQAMGAEKGDVVELDAGVGSKQLCDRLAELPVTAVVLLVGLPTPALSIVQAIRSDPRLVDLLIGAPAGQPELAQWNAMLGKVGAGVPFLRYRSAKPNALCSMVEDRLRERLGARPSFVALEGYDTILVLASLLAGPIGEVDIVERWRRVVVEGTRGTIQFDRPSETGVWQWEAAPIDVVERDPDCLERYRPLS